MNVPDDLRYSSDHEWVRVEGTIITLGITDYAQDALGDVVFVDVPDVGTVVAATIGLARLQGPTKQLVAFYRQVSATRVKYELLRELLSAGNDATSKLDSSQT